MCGFPGSTHACRRSPGVLRYGPLSGSPQYDGDLPVRMAAAPSPRTAMTEARRVSVFSFQIEHPWAQVFRRKLSSGQKWSSSTIIPAVKKHRCRHPEPSAEGCAPQATRIVRKVRLILSPGEFRPRLLGMECCQYFWVDPSIRRRDPGSR